MPIIGILIWPDSEVLDFCGPFEVWRNAGSFIDEDVKVVMIAKTKDPVSAMGMTIIPNYAFDDCPVLDMLIIPGGNSAWAVEQGDLIEWIRNKLPSTNLLLTVCTGALLAAKADAFPEGMELTTHQEGLARLQELAPHAKVLPNVRFTHMGSITTSGGISAGIDSSLYLVSQLYGVEIATKVARYMEYDWNIRQPNLDDPALH